MNCSQLGIVSAACLMTLAAGQVLLPTANARPHSTPHLSVQFLSVQTKYTARGLELTGQVKNIGTQALAYTSLILILRDGQGREIERRTGYLTAGPLAPSQTTEFRAYDPTPPPFAHVQMVVRESGLPVTVSGGSF